MIISRKFFAVFLLGLSVCRSGDAKAAEPTPRPIAEETATASASAKMELQQAVITADTMELVTKEDPNVVTFEKNVVITDPQFVLRCSKLVAKFDAKTRKVVSVDATGGVIVTQPKRVGRAERASYTPEDGKIVLEGDPRLEGEEGTLAGKVITFYRDSEKVIVSGGTRMEIAPDKVQIPNTPPKTR